MRMQANAACMHRFNKSVACTRFDRNTHLGIDIIKINGLMKNCDNNNYIGLNKIWRRYNNSNE